MIRREPAVPRAGRLDGAMEGRKDGGREEEEKGGGSVVVEAWLQGVSMAGLPKYP